MSWLSRLSCRFGVHYRKYKTTEFNKVCGWQCERCPIGYVYPQPWKPSRQDAATSIDLSGLCDDETPIIVKPLPITEKKDREWAMRIVNDLPIKCSHCGHAWANHDGKVGCRMGNDNRRDGRPCACPWLPKDPGTMTIDATKGGEVEFTLAKTETIMLQPSGEIKIDEPDNFVIRTNRCDDCSHLWSEHTYGSGCLNKDKKNTSPKGRTFGQGYCLCWTDQLKKEKERTMAEAKCRCDHPVNMCNACDHCFCLHHGLNAACQADIGGQACACEWWDFSKEKKVEKPILEIPALKDLKLQVKVIGDQVNHIMDELKRLWQERDCDRGMKETKRMSIGKWWMGPTSVFLSLTLFLLVFYMPTPTQVTVTAPVEPTCEYCGTEDGVWSRDVVARACGRCQSFHHCCDGDFKHNSRLVMYINGNTRWALWSCPKLMED